MKLLLARQETLTQKLKARKNELQDAQRRQRNNLKRQIRRAQTRLSAAERKRRTRRLIVLGSVLEKQHSHPELIALLDQALDRDQDRALFDLPPRSVSGQAPPSAPLSGWTPAKITDGAWGARFQGDTRTLPDNLKGLNISVRTSRGKSWDATVTEVVDRSPDRILVRTQRLDAMSVFSGVRRRGLNRGLP